MFRKYVIYIIAQIWYYVYIFNIFHHTEESESSSSSSDEENEAELIRSKLHKAEQELIVTKGVCFDVLSLVLFVYFLVLCFVSVSV